MNPYRSSGHKMATTKPNRTKLYLILLQLISLLAASVILAVYYNPWIERIIDEAEKSGNAGQTLADQISSVDGEEIVIFLMSTITILVSVLGLIGTLRSGSVNSRHSHCLLNFYMSTLIIFLFVIFVAMCGTAWQLVSKINQSTSAAPFHPSQPPYPATPRPVVNDFDIHSSSSFPLPRPTSPTSIVVVTWWYLGKSFVFIILSATLFATSLHLTKRILESMDDHFLSSSDDGDDLSSETSSTHGALGTHALYNPNKIGKPGYLYDAGSVSVAQGIFNNGALIGSHGKKSSFGSADSNGSVNASGRPWRHV